MSEDRIAVAQQVAGKFGKGKGLPQLLDYPFLGWVGGHIEMQNAAPVMSQHQETQRTWKRIVGTVKKSMETSCWT